MVAVPGITKRASGGGKGGGGGGSKGGGGGKGSSSSAGKPGGVTINSGYSNRGASRAGYGGGDRVTIPSGVFAGRSIGGGTRPEVYGGPRYYSGYPYTPASTYVGGRGFPFGFWPIFIFPHPYYGNHEYGPANNDSRPGGPMYEAQVTLSTWPATPDPSNPNATSPYYIIGDQESLSSVAEVLTSNCSATVASAIPVDVNLLQPEQIVSYYRAGSFALALSSYYDPAQSYANDNVTENSNLTTTPTLVDAPIPNGTNLTFFACLNDTITENIPIMDASSALKITGVGMGQLAFFWVVLFSMLGIL